MVKKFLSAFIFILIASIFLSGCQNEDEKKFISDYFHFRKIEQTKIAVGDLSSDFRSNSIYIPNKINSYSVIQLGYD